MTRSTILSLCAVLSVGTVLTPSAEAMIATPWEFPRGVAAGERRHDRHLDRLLGQPATLQLDDYQAIGEIVPSITKGRQTLSLFTAGLGGAPPPRATIAGSSITVDLSSLFVSLARTHGDGQRIVNIGGLATGTYDPDTRAFSLTWEHLFDGRKHERVRIFTLKGIVASGPEPVAIPAAAVLYTTGLFGLGSWAWRRRRRSPAAA